MDKKLVWRDLFFAFVLHIDDDDDEEDDDGEMGREHLLFDLWIDIFKLKLVEDENLWSNKYKDASCF